MNATARYLAAILPRSRRGPRLAGKSSLIEAEDEAAAEVHHVEIDDAKLHYHAKTDEVYYIIDGAGTMVLDDETIEVHRGVVVYVPRGVKHKAIGKLTATTVCIPAGARRRPRGGVRRTTNGNAITPIIRPESPADLKAIHQVNRLAFGQDDEAVLVDALCAGGHVRLSLVAEVDGDLVGHVFFSDLPILTDRGVVPALAAP